MAGIYIHIPFCKQACHYCNFHFSTSSRRKNELLAALLSEIDLRKDYLKGERVETIYFGGGTPSLLDSAGLARQLDKLLATFNVMPGAEITIETNPDDIGDDELKDWKRIGFNRLSIGIQSFFEDDLKWMNRAHSAAQAISSLELAKNYFENISIDLIYGLPSFTNEKWRQNVNKALSNNVPHLSCYALTVEPKTRLHKMIAGHQVDNVDPDQQSEQFLLLMQWMAAVGYEQYEISNFAKPGFRSQHNSSYWQQRKYLGIGPSSHSYNGSERQWNVANNNIYINSINSGIVPHQKEVLTSVQRLNEYIMTSLRTMEGIDLDYLPQTASNELRVESEKYFKRGLMVEEQNHLKLTTEGKLLADGIAADLFFI